MTRVQRAHAQRHADKFYRARGCRVLTREPGGGAACILDIGGKPTRVGEQFRQAHPDISIEVLRDKVTCELGWVYDVRCDLFNFFACDRKWTPTHLHQVIDWQAFRLWFSAYVRAAAHPLTSWTPRGWGASVNVFVPLTAIPDELMRHYQMSDDVAA